ncbi:hypothetical protein PP740_gp036 [Stenotrophomonas phage Philippe]|uniref:Uncharacterized protein n=1 Tax=Stenotrophomonas phage Philippe TaxID=2859655 RepID=A0AAE7WMM1_9CAUD|nr:hypothetical protein PP740_gp036 [Stenotrophomonas phage Philippe]QYW02235.1 hypothetical protein CPT_Philippe_036 [Stenotrophomonas phage Philippe]
MTKSSEWLDPLYLCPMQAVVPVDHLLMPLGQSAIALGQLVLCQVLTALMNPGQIVVVDTQAASMFSDSRWESAIGLIAKAAKCRYVLDVKLNAKAELTVATIRFESLE